jgi:hypothetical protein
VVGSTAPPIETFTERGDGKIARFGREYFPADLPRTCQPFVHGTSMRRCLHSFTSEPAAVFVQTAAISGCVRCNRALSNPERASDIRAFKRAIIAPHENPNHEFKVRDAKGGTPDAPR